MRFTRLAPIAVAALCAACTSGDAPLSPRADFQVSRRLSIQPQFTVLGGAYQSAPINRIHLVARAQPGLTVFADTVLEVRPDDPSWQIGLDLRVPEGMTEATVVVTIELINVTGGVPTIEWSGATEPISVTPGGVSAPPPPVPVFPGPPANLSITSIIASPETMSLVEGDSALFTATVSGATGTPLIVWSTLDPNIASVSLNGAVRGLRNGTARVVAQAGPKADTVVAVFAQRVAAVSIPQDSAVFASLGEEAVLRARALDPRGDSIAGSAVTYVVRDAGIAESLGDGRVAARGNGRTYLVATSAVQPAQRDSALLVVTQRAASAAITPGTATSTAIGATTQFTATARDARGNDMVVSRTWSSDNAAVATVDATGVARAVANGSARITATFAGGVIATATLTVSQQPATVQVTPADIVFTAIGDTARATATARDANGNAVTGTAVQWTSSAPGIVSVDATGLLRASTAGSATITARAGTVIGTTTATVSQRVARITVSPSSATLVSLGETLAFSAAALDRNGAPIANTTLAWRSGTAAVASVNAAGVATAVANGTTFVYAEADGARDSAQLTVRQTASRIDIAGPDSIAVGDVATMTAAVVDARGNATAGAITWSSSAPQFATVDAAGSARGVAVGTATITAGNGAQTASRSIRVFRAEAASVTLAADSIVMTAIGDSIVMGADVRDSRGRPALGATQAWSSSNTAVATVDAGVIVARRPGSASIILFVDNRSDTVRVNVRQAASTLSLTPDSVVLAGVGQQTTLTVVARDSRNNPIVAPAITFTSLTPSVATVSSTGVVTAVSAGTARIVAAVGVARDTTTVRVILTSPNLTLVSVAVVPTDSFRVGGSYPVTAVVRNTGTAASPAAVVRFALHVTPAAAPVAFVDAPIAALNPGDSIAVIRPMVFDTVTAYPDTMYGVVTVDPGALIAESSETDNSITRPGIVVMNVASVVTPDSIAITAAIDSVRLTVSVVDKFSRLIRRPGVVWTSSNPTIATVSATGLVRYQSQGTALVIAAMEGKADTTIVRAGAPTLPSGSPTITKTWVGTSSTWQTASNWSPAGVPTAADSVLISSGTPSQPVLAAPASVGGLVVTTGAQLDLGFNDLGVTGTIVAPGAVVSNGGAVVLQGSGTFRGNLPNTYVNSTRTLSGTTTTGNVVIGDAGNLIINSTLLVSGDVQWDSYGFITMDNPAGVLNVAGDFRMNRYDGSVPTWSAGTLLVQGDFSTGGNSSEVLRASGTHRVILNGSTAQVLSIAYGSDGRHYFNNIDFSNPDSVIVVNNFYVNNVATVTAGKVVGGATARIVNGIADPVGNRWQLATTLLIGPAPQLPAAMRTNILVGTSLALSSDVVVNGNIDILDGGNLRPNGNTVRVTGAFTLNSYGFLTMTNSADVLDVGGNILLNRYDGSVPSLTAGEIRVQGDFATGGNSSEVLRAAGTHKVVFNGTGQQNLSIAYGNDGRHYFNKLEFANPDSVRVLTPIWINDTGFITAGKVVGAGTAHVRNGIIDAVGSRWQIRSNHMFGPTVVIPQTIFGDIYFDTPVQLGTDIRVRGSVFIYSGADLRLNGHVLTVDSAFTWDSYGFLTMNNPADVLDVAGNILMNRYDGSVPTLTAGVIRVQGNFATGGNSSEVLRASGSHKVIFNGTRLQTIALAYGNDGRHYFNDIEFANPDSVVFAVPGWVNGNAVISTGRVVGPTTVHTVKGVTDAVGGRWRVAMTHFIGMSTLAPTNITGSAYFTNAVSLPLNATISGDVFINDGGNLILNGHTMRVLGAFTWNSYGFLTMTNAADVLDVAGSMLMNRFDGSVPALTAGEIRLQGDFATGGNSSEVLRPSGTHKFIFNGTTMQTVALAYGGDGRHYFNDAVFANPDSVRVNGQAWVNGNAIVTAGRVVGNSTIHVVKGVTDSIGYRWVVPMTRFLGFSTLQPTRITGSAVFTSAVAPTVDFTATGSAFINDGADLRLNGRTFRVNGDFTLNSYGFFRMDSTTDVLDVGGNVLLNRFDGSVPVLTAGEMRVQGNFSTGGNSSEVFRPGGTHTVVFNGTTAQTISFAYSDGRHYFRNIDVRNAAGVTFNTNAIVMNNMTVSSPPNGSRLIVPSGISVDVVNELRITAQAILNNAGSVTYEFYTNNGTVTGNVPQYRGGT